MGEHKNRQIGDNKLISAQPGTPLYRWCKRISEMKPGECLQIDRYDLRDIASFEHNDAWFYPPDRILGNIVGSAYTHSYDDEPMRGWVTFYRHEETGRVWYNDPDRR